MTQNEPRQRYARAINSETFIRNLGCKIFNIGREILHVKFFNEKKEIKEMC